MRIAYVATVPLSLRVLLLPQMRGLRDAGHEIHAVSAPGPLVAAVEAEGFRHVPWPSVTREWDPRADLHALWELLGILHRGNYDLVHTHTPKPGVMGRLSARLVGVPRIVNTCHGLYTSRTDPPLKRGAVLAAELAAARFSDRELFVGRDDLEWLSRLSATVDRKARWLGQGIDIERFTPGSVPQERSRALRRKLGIPRDAPVVGTLARLTIEKGYVELSDAAREVRAHLPGAVFVAAGSPEPDRPAAMSPERLASVGGDVIFAGYQPDVRDLLSAIDVFVLPSHREGLSRSALEAASMGKAMVLSDIPGNREIVEHGETGLLVPPRDAPALASAIRSLLVDPALRARLGGAAREQARARFDERRVVDSLDAFYRELPARRDRPAPRR